MGVDYYPCANCGQTFPDCGEFTACNEEFGGCGKWYCSDECAQVQKCEYDVEGDYEGYDHLTKDEKNKNKTTCINCRGEHASDTNVLTWLLKRLYMTRKKANQEYLKDKKGEK